MLRVAVFLVLASVACAQRAPLSPPEVRTLLAIGVAESEVVAAAERFGGFGPACPDDVDLLFSVGASPELVARFPQAEDPLAVLRALAERSETWVTPRGDALLVPKGWRGADVPVGEGAVAYRIAPSSASAARAGVDPALFVFVQEKSAVPAEGVASVAGRLEAMLARRLSAAECPSRPTATGTLRGFGGEIPLRRVETSTAKRPGLVAVAFALLPDGRAVGLGYSAPEAMRAACERHLEDLARSFAAPRGR